MAWPPSGRPAEEGHEPDRTTRTDGRTCTRSTRARARPWNAAPRGEGPRRALPDGEGRRVPPLVKDRGACRPS
jgi:hypothetical protein